jgi:glutathione synthase/RimK-type ligase-like ATP-grasp enzyme
MTENREFPRTTTRVAVFTVKNDLHALLLRERMHNDFGIFCHIIETEELSLAGDFSWTCEGAWLNDSEGNRLDPATLDLIWWRRCNRQRGSRGNEIEDRIVSRSSADALHGLAWTSFSGILLDDPIVIYRAENKLVQLAAAKRAGLSVPATLVSKNAEEIRSFARAMGGSLVIKAVRGTHDAVLETVKVSLEDFRDNATLEVCPSIYQELVHGTGHLRILALTNHAVAVQIQSEKLDWRGDSQVKAFPYQLDAATFAGIKRLLALLNLRMGVLDMKLTPQGPVFLEINPQGQFLFAEGLSGTDMIGPFTQFVADLVRNGSTGERA